MKSFMSSFLSKRPIKNMLKKNPVQQHKVLCISNFIHNQTLIKKAENKETVQQQPESAFSSIANVPRRTAFL